MVAVFLIPAVTGVTRCSKIEGKAIIDPFTNGAV
jgi:hypothetical protein